MLCVVWFHLYNLKNVKTSMDQCYFQYRCENFPSVESAQTIQFIPYQTNKSESYQRKICNIEPSQSMVKHICCKYTNYSLMNIMTLPMDDYYASTK